MKVSEKRPATIKDVPEGFCFLGRLAIENHENRLKQFSVERDGSLTVKRHGAKCKVYVRFETYSFGLCPVFTAQYK